MAGRRQGVVLSFLYWSLRRLLELVVLRRRSEREKEIEILVLRQQLRVLERQVARPQLTQPTERCWRRLPAHWRERVGADYPVRSVSRLPGDVIASWGTLLGIRIASRDRTPGGTAEESRLVTCALNESVRSGLRRELVLDQPAEQVMAA